MVQNYGILGRFDLLKSNKVRNVQQQQGINAEQSIMEIPATDFVSESRDKPKGGAIDPKPENKHCI
ncbi:Hypothetical predicted protein [Olea europaea subsp. europaea]|uniref:Uncharacterized protein n=1 Tax=Olea europaea subsp. europaea TaxID=158383 RepID=A0A8S0QSD1_OLEEU|nr:Hypothetical predicted protein [Olea europaea subsp. europaea]